MDLRQLQILRAGSFKNLMLMKARQKGARAQLCFLKHIHERRDVGFPVFTRPGPTPDVRTACATDQRMAVTANVQMSVLRGRTNETSTASALSRTRCANSIEVGSARADRL
jgi:hypothetical protein